MLLNWLNRHWVPASLCMALMLLALFPIMSLRWGGFFLLIYLQMPFYMLHQVEEHTNDRFRKFVNERVFHGVEALSPAAILWINIPGVWGVVLLALYGAAFFGPGWGLSAVYLAVVNGLTHVMGALISRSYNPGLWTSIVLFLPAGALALVEASRMSSIMPVHHVVGLGVALGIHVVIVGYARARAASAQPCAVV
ncbi:MAG TPA: HXXEE domain-containing protein [Bryobacteraceae bacterium]|nr:HXXEE domain-containing protein [Bryobacteraceae bacterium]